MPINPMNILNALIVLQYFPLYTLFMIGGFTGVIIFEKFLITTGLGEFVYPLGFIIGFATTTLLFFLSFFFLVVKKNTYRGNSFGQLLLRSIFNTTTLTDRGAILSYLYFGLAGWLAAGLFLPILSSQLNFHWVQKIKFIIYGNMLYGTVMMIMAAVRKRQQTREEVAVPPLVFPKRFMVSFFFCIAFAILFAIGAKWLMNFNIEGNVYLIFGKIICFGIVFFFGLRLFLRVVSRK